MLASVNEIIEAHPNREAFFSIIGTLYSSRSAEFKLIAKSYDTAKKAFEGDFRRSGERYFEHLRRVALIDVIYLHVTDPNEIAALLLHDILEDKAEFGWNQDRLALEFNDIITVNVFGMSKDPIELHKNDEDLRNRRFHAKIRNGTLSVRRGKLCDVLDNQMTLWAKPIESQKKKVWEAEYIYLPIAETHGILAHEIAEAIAARKASWNKMK